MVWLVGGGWENESKGRNISTIYSVSKVRTGTEAFSCEGQRCGTRCRAAVQREVLCFLYVQRKVSTVYMGTIQNGLYVYVSTVTEPDCSHTAKNGPFAENRVFKKIT